MKKALLSLLVLFAFATVVLAQEQSVPTVNKVPVNPWQKSFDIKMHKENLDARNSKAIRSRWYNYAFTMYDVTNGDSKLNQNILFPDTTILVNYSTGYSGPWIHMLGNNCDPSSYEFNDNSLYPNEMKINDFMPYTVDSIAFYCWYFRLIPDPSIVDTLIIEVYTSNNSNDFVIGGWVDPSAPAVNYGTDTLFYGRYYFHASDMSSKATNVKTYTVLLTEAFANDTLPDGSNVAYIATPDVAPINPGKIVLSTFKFIPGYTWIANLDTISSVNQVRFHSYEERGDETWSYYTKRDWNCSYITMSDCVFDPAGGWYERQVPEYAFTDASYAYENHVISYLLTADESGIETVTSNILTLSQNQPNPFNDITTIRYSLSEIADVTFDLYDQTGRKVMNIKRGIEMPGNYTIDVDAANLQNGIYFYTLNAGSSKASKKMVVLK